MTVLWGLRPLGASSLTQEKNLYAPSQSLVTCLGSHGENQINPDLESRFPDFYFLLFFD